MGEVKIPNYYLLRMYIIQSKEPTKPNNNPEDHTQIQLHNYIVSDLHSLNMREKQEIDNETINRKEGNYLGIG